MAGLFSNDPETPEGKYPIVLRRDGTPLDTPYFVLALKDPAAERALLAYADAAESIGFDDGYVRDIRKLARRCREVRLAEKPGDPDAPRHRKDDPVTIAWARSIKSQGA